MPNQSLHLVAWIRGVWWLIFDIPDIHILISRSSLLNMKCHCGRSWLNVCVPNCMIKWYLQDTIIRSISSLWKPGSVLKDKTDSCKGHCPVILKNEISESPKGSNLYLVYSPIKWQNLVLASHLYCFSHTEQKSYYWVFRDASLEVTVLLSSIHPQSLSVDTKHLWDFRKLKIVNLKIYQELFQGIVA